MPLRIFGNLRNEAILAPPKAPLIRREMRGRKP